MYAPYCDAYTARCVDRRGRPPDGAMQGAPVPGLAERHSLTVSDWLSLAVDGRPNSEAQVERMKHDLGASLDLLDNALQIPKELSPFNGLRTQECAQPEDQGEVDGGARNSLGTSGLPSPHRYSPTLRARSSWSEERALEQVRHPPHRIKSDYKILKDWQAQHVSLKECIEARTNERPRTSRHSWKLPLKPEVATLEGPVSWTKLVVSSKLAQVQDNDLKVKTELEHSLRDIFYATAEEQRADDRSGDDLEEWRRSLRFSLFHGGITSRN